VEPILSYDSTVHAFTFCFDSFYHYRPLYAQTSHIVPCFQTETYGSLIFPVYACPPSTSFVSLSMSIYHTENNAAFNGVIILLYITYFCMIHFSRKQL
jgi:hypothetical protein